MVGILDHSFGWHSLPTPVGAGQADLAYRLAQFLGNIPHFQLR
jgi:hypothetical protein